MSRLSSGCFEVTGFLL